MSYRPTPANSDDKWDETFYPHGDEKVFASMNSLFDHRVAHFPDHPFLSDLTRHFAYAQVDRLVNTVAKDYGKILPPRKKGESSKAVGVLWRGGIEYLIHDYALQRL